MPASVDPELIVDAIMMHVDDLNEAAAGTGDGWLVTEFNRVLAAYMAGAVFVTALSMESSSSQQSKEVNTGELLAILTQCRKRKPNAQGFSDNPGTPCMLIPRLGDFPFSRTS